MGDVALRVEHLGKRYRLGATQRYKALRDSLAEALRRPWRRRDPQAAEPWFWALDDVSFDVKRGEVVGIIGRNGAGKSTLLKILSRITEPTRGSAEIAGRVGSLLEVGTGFHPELTGRENVYLNGAILGMSRREIIRKFDAIVAFAGVERFLDTPIKQYSSGMYVRLAFAVAAHLEPDILLVDEVLGVGDAGFQRKCLGKMEEVAHEGRTVLFVSHNMAAIDHLCRRGLVLEQGHVAYDGSQTGAIAEYLRTVTGNTVALKDRADRFGSGTVRVTGVELRDVDGHVLDVVSCGQDVDIYLHFETEPGFQSERVIASLALTTAYEVPVFLHHNRLTQESFGPLPRRGALVCRLQRLPLPPATYHLTYSLIVDGQYLDCIRHAVQLQVIEGDFFGSSEVPPASRGVCLVDAHWRVAVEAAMAEPAAA